jgi:hypothetical protein
MTYASVVLYSLCVCVCGTWFPTAVAMCLCICVCVFGTVEIAFAVGFHVTHTHTQTSGYVSGYGHTSLCFVFVYLCYHLQNVPIFRTRTDRFPDGGLG